ncbi:hypothetical protein F4778DRAFT_788911 [Xylariomycetidae sp. FL2044]|nr:hypothetical protein F4778DRAFT_788911 [Xylariomycetidae sp. FL2044]
MPGLAHNELQKPLRCQHYNPRFPQYKGYIAHDHSDDIADDENTSIFFQGLPQDTTYLALLRGIKRAGNIKHSHIMAPTPQHPTTCAATVVFFERAAAESAYASGQSGGILVQGIRPRVAWNRVKQREENSDERSRVLRIQGPVNMNSVETIENLWAQYFYWNTCWVLDIGELDGGYIIWCYFAGWLNQAADAKAIVEQVYGPLIRIDRDTTFYDLLRRIRKARYIKHADILRPTADSPTSCAATLVFFERTAAELVLWKSHNNQLSIRGVNPIVVSNFHQKPAEDPNGRSRVLRIEGPEEVLAMRLFTGDPNGPNQQGSHSTMEHTHLKKNIDLSYDSQFVRQYKTSMS